LRGIGRHAGERLRLEAFQREGAHVVEGVLFASDGDWYPVLEGVPLFVGDQERINAFAAKHHLSVDKLGATWPEQGQTQTQNSFSHKWNLLKQWGLHTGEQEFLLDWYCRKLGVADRDGLQSFYRSRRRVLEVGPGSGFNTRYIAQQCPGEVFALDISDAADTTFANTKELANCTVVRADLMESPFEDFYFDLIMADGVLHHTPDTRAAVQALYTKLAPGGKFFFYVYRKMGAARQFCDVHIRQRFTEMPADECYAACEGLTELGRELSRLCAKITLKRGIPVLGIPAGTHDVQRLLYYNFLKCFWNEAFDFDTNNMVNFDWYHPHYAWQHTAQEVEGWLRALGVRDFQFNDANPNGISVLLTKDGDRQ
jgi:SAM-dependent methyltransferase